MALGHNMLTVIVALCYTAAFLFLMIAKRPFLTAKNSAEPAEVDITAV